MGPILGHVLTDHSPLSLSYVLCLVHLHLQPLFLPSLAALSSPLARPLESVRGRERLSGRVALIYSSTTGAMGRRRASSSSSADHL